MEVRPLRERKKLETRRALIAAARNLVDHRGLGSVTVDAIAQTAGYTARTFFNHFSCKEAAVVAHDPVILARLAEEVRTRPASEHPADALRAVLVNGPDSGARYQNWKLRHDLVVRYPKLLACYLVATDEAEGIFTQAIADRIGADPSTDPTVRMFVSAVMAAGRAAAYWWLLSDRTTPLPVLLNRAFDLVSRTQIDAMSRSSLSTDASSLPVTFETITNQASRTFGLSKASSSITFQSNES